MPGKKRKTWGLKTEEGRKNSRAETEVVDKHRKWAEKILDNILPALVRWSLNGNCHDHTEERCGQ